MNTNGTNPPPSISSSTSSYPSVYAGYDSRGLPQTHQSSHHHPSSHHQQFYYPSSSSSSIYQQSQQQPTGPSGPVNSYYYNTSAAPQQQSVPHDPHAAAHAAPGHSSEQSPYHYGGMYQLHHQQQQQQQQQQNQHHQQQPQQHQQQQQQQQHQQQQQQLGGPGQLAPSHSGAPQATHPHLHHHIQQQQQNFYHYPQYAMVPSGVNSTGVPSTGVVPPAPQAVVTDPTGQTAPPGVKPKVTTTLWEDEGTLCFQVEAKGICVARREDNDMINGTKLLNVAGMTRGRRDGILKGEKNRHVVKAGAMHLKGVWIPYERAIDFANKEKIIDLLYPLFVTDIKAVLYHPANYARTAQVLSAAAERRKDINSSSSTSSSSSSSTGAPAASSSYYYNDGRKEEERRLPSVQPSGGHQPGVSQQTNGQIAQNTQQNGQNGSQQTAQNGHTSSYQPYPQSSYPGSEYSQSLSHTQSLSQSRVATPDTVKSEPSQPTQMSYMQSRYLPQINSYYGNQRSESYRDYSIQPGPQPQQTSSDQQPQEYQGSTTPLTDSMPHTPSSASLLTKPTSQNDEEESKHLGRVVVVPSSGTSSNAASPKTEGI